MGVLIRELGELGSCWLIRASLLVRGAVSRSVRTSGGDLDYDDYDRAIYAGPEHRRWNRATAGRHLRRLVSRRW